LPIVARAVPSEIVTPGRIALALLLLLPACGDDGVQPIEELEDGSSSTGEEVELEDDGPGLTSTSGHAPEGSSSGEPDVGSSSDDGESSGGSSEGESSTGEPVCLVEGTGFPCTDVLGYAEICDSTHPDVRPQCFLALAILFGGDQETQALAIAAYDVGGQPELDACAAEVGEPVCAVWAGEPVGDCAARAFESGPNASVHVCVELGAG
jgi:hypothetical protein